MDEEPDYIDILASDRMEWEILQLLLLSHDETPVWTIGAVLEATADPITALDALAMLCDVGLAQRRGEEYVMITAAALRFHFHVTRPPSAEWVRPTA